MPNSARSSAIRLLLIDDHTMFRESLATLLQPEPGFEVAGHFRSSVEAREMLTGNLADIVLLDVELGNERAIDFIEASKRWGYRGQFLILTGGVSPSDAIQLIRVGVSGILHKHNASDVLFRGIRQIAAGEVTLEKVYVAALVRSLDNGRASAQPQLTERDRNLIRLVLQGLSNGDIGARLKISEGTVKTSLRQVCEKVGVRNRPQLVRVALEQYRDQL